LGGKTPHGTLVKVMLSYAANKKTVSANIQGDTGTALQLVWHQFTNRPQCLQVHSDNTTL
jgi:hypothetical protein